MLTEERYATILRILEEKKAVTVLDLTRALDASESTVRRDLTALHKSGRLYKVYGGATSIDNNYSSAEEDMKTKNDLFPEEKIAIARKAAELIKSKDFVYIDAGSTTLHLIDFLTENSATFVTNGMQHAAKLAAKGFRVFIIGGAVKAVTEAVIGTEALNNLKSYNFTKGFFGTNGISPKSGFSTPDADEGTIKSAALSRCKNAYILADQSKFNKISPITFANISSATIITGRLEDKKYRDYTTVIEGE
ncbi:MAG: DeoR/GlpR family DNA-binding transcription regulator [Selenomonas sp.]|uniref:DeoR/GlpR family DNA-binding transcription regulator n=1 Tax=Selenomonas sp. TaxID=2053611 RepID=UPI0025D1EA37|nr:DeoR/GlpR family DNA-binding transcription regulator [Selenomonas sp.]MCR5758342.1 DeoR/GlpR family DNA-binding transcription regulator [Selenomonas sp.]